MVPVRLLGICLRWVPWCVGMNKQKRIRKNIIMGSLYFVLTVFVGWSLARAILENGTILAPPRPHLQPKRFLTGRPLGSQSGIWPDSKAPGALSNYEVYLFEPGPPAVSPQPCATLRNPALPAYMPTHSIHSHRHIRAHTYTYLCTLCTRRPRTDPCPTQPSPKRRHVYVRVYVCV